MFYSIILFVVAAVTELGGAYLIWQCLNNGKPLWFAVAGAVVLFLYGFIQTVQTFSFGRAFVAYCGLFIVAATLWGWWMGAHPTVAIG